MTSKYLMRVGEDPLHRPALSGGLTPFGVLVRSWQQETARRGRFNGDTMRGKPGAGQWLTIGAAALAFLAGPAHAHRFAPLVAVELYDRSSGATLDVHWKDGQRFVVGTPGHEYAVRIRNLSGERVLAVTSVDGVNVISGETASPDQSGYVIDGRGSVEIAGWRTSLQRTSAFYFTDLGDSYAARTGRPANVGIVGIAVYREQAAPIAREAPANRIAAEAAAGARDSAPAARAEAPAAADSASKARTLASQLGTGFGRDEASYAQRVQFRRASEAPSETITFRYDRRENLIAMGVLPAPYDVSRAPDAFPAMRFVAPPR
jgi:hypothetical protein